MSQPYEPAQLLELHRRLCHGDRTASEELADLILEPLVERVSRRFPRIDDQIIWDAVIDAFFLEYCSRPPRFDAGRAVPLDAFLLMAARRNVANALRGEARRRAREAEAAQDDAPSAVELDPTAGNILQQEETRQVQRQQDLMRLLQDPKDRRVLALRLQGERRTEAFAKILGISHLPTEVQRWEVKRAKDRIDKIVRRKGGGS